MTDRDLALAVLEGLQEGIASWRYPNSVMPELAPSFGRFFRGEPLVKVDYTELDSIIKATGAKFTHHWRCSVPRCDRIRDKIVMPLRSYFTNEATYHATRIHEVLHHLEQPWRLGWIGSDHQSELVSEIGTGFLESYLRLPPDQDNTNINKWLPTWKREIEANHRYLFDAVAQAERSVNYLIGLRRRKAA